MVQTAGWWLFLVVAPAVYWASAPAIRPTIVAVSSALVLCSLSPFSIAFMLLVALATFAWFQAPHSRVAVQGIAPVASKNIGARPLRGAVIPVTGLVFVLFYFKYAPALGSGNWFSFGSIAPAWAPIGLSYFSFRMIHYALERGRGTLPRHGLGDFLAWILLMPIFTSGPIERMDHFLAGRTATFRAALLVEGGTRIVQGLIKKFVVSDLLARMGDRMVGSDLAAFAHAAGGVSAAVAVWGFLICALLALYLDFSAYSDIAIGCSRLFGFKITENFNYPLLSTNLTEFWRCWHMSLTQWCRAYVYMPMVGWSRNPYLAIVVTFVVVGLWHGGSIHWLCWGLWHGIGQAVVIRWQRFAARKRIKVFQTRPGAVLAWALTTAYVSLGGTLVAFYPDGHFADTFYLMAHAFGW